MRLNSYYIFQNAITRLLTICVARTEWLCGIMSKLGNVQFGPNSFSTKKSKKHCMHSPLQRTETIQKPQNRLERSPRSSFTTLQLYTSAVGEHKISYKLVWCLCVEKRECFCRTHRRKLWWQVTKKKHRVNFCNFFFLFLKQSNRNRHKYINSVSLPGLRFELFLLHLFFILPSEIWNLRLPDAALMQPNSRINSSFCWKYLYGQLYYSRSSFQMLG